MRTLLLFRGAPGSGKSTYIDEHGLKPFTLSADEIRLQCQSAQQDIFGHDVISMDNEKTTWKVLFNLLETRMSKGEFTVIDANNSKSIEMNRYKELAETYKYRIFIIDFTKLPIEECKRRNASRPYLKRVSEESIDKMYARFKNQKIPSGIKSIDPDNLDQIFLHKIDLSEYKNIIHIGDIHGCFEPLEKYFKENPINDENFYIFVGDYLDRGIENASVMQFLLEIYDRKNVLLLEGNHERWIQIYAKGGVGRSREFEFKTKPQLQESKIPLKDLRMFYRKLGQCAWYEFKGKEVFVSHGGIATIPDNLTMMSTEQLIHGVGRYEDYETVADTWMSTTKENQYQVFGHRNIRGSLITLRDRVFDLEGQVEFGGQLRILELNEFGEFVPVYVDNHTFRLPGEVEKAAKPEEKKSVETIQDLILNLRSNKFIAEKQFDNNISSFNFTKQAFFNKVWNEQTEKARGLYINTDKFKIVARGFDKFFNIDERPETEFPMLKYTLQFPVKCYVKENGYLGLISYNEETDDLFITTKSDPTGDFAMWLKNHVTTNLDSEQIQYMKDYCKEHNCTLVFEFVDMVHDPHIIKYDSNKLFLLSIVYNEINFRQASYTEVQKVANKIGTDVKTLGYEIDSWEEFYDWYNEVLDENYLFNDRLIEGFVIEDSKGFMTKLKLSYYNFWKHMRSVAHQTLRKGYIDSTGQLYDAKSNDFYAFLQNLYNSKETKEERESITRNIIELRDMFESQ